MQGSGQNRLFISYRRDGGSSTAQLLRLALEKRGLEVFLDVEELGSGRFNKALLREIENCSVFLSILSPNALDRCTNTGDWVRAEIAQAIACDKLIIPVMVSGFDWPPSLPDDIAELANFQGVRLIHDMFDACVDKLVKLLPPPPPPPPHKHWPWLAALAAGAIVALALAWGYHIIHTAPPADPERPAPSADGFPDYHALVIGIDSYASGDDAGWNDLVTARADAETVAECLESTYGFTVTRLLDGEATQASMLKALDDLVTFGDNDAVLVYFAGHGYFDAGLNEGYWIPCDAKREQDGKPAKAGWIGNATINKVLGASQARHILVVADSCYSGALLRGIDPKGLGGLLPDANRLRKALAMPSRYLLASGGEQPVVDGDGKHSVFAQQIISFLRHTELSSFTATDLAESAREQVAALTHQNIVLSPFAVGTHSGGEFVFAKTRGRRDALGQPSAEAAPPPQRTAPAKEELLKNALALSRDGATNAANTLLSLAGNDDNYGFVAAVRRYVDDAHRTKAREALSALVERIERRKRETTNAPASTQTLCAPRILACLGPRVRNGGPDAIDTALLYRIALQSALMDMPGLRVVEREALDDLLTEIDLSASSLSDREARLAIGKLLPAGFMIFGDRAEISHSEHLLMKLVETETGVVLASEMREVKGLSDALKACQEIASRFREVIAEKCPLEAPVTALDGNLVTVPLGAFHGIQSALRFSVMQPAADGDSCRSIGIATISDIGEDESKLKVDWTTGIPESPAGLTIREEPQQKATAR